MEANVFERTNYTEEEYFELFDQFERKIEYHNGRIEMMAGASSYHNDISINILLAQTPLGQHVCIRNCT